MSGRRLGAQVLGVAVGLAGFAVLLGAGLLLYRRLWGDSTTWLVVAVVVFGLGGAYAGWILGVMVYSAAGATGNPLDLDESRDVDADRSGGELSAGAGEGLGDDGHGTG